MKTEDFERLKAVCEKEGFWVDDNHSLALFHIMVKDPWDGVEFATDGIMVYKVYEISNNWVYYGSNIDGKKERAGKSFMKPSTESAYVEQLKKEAFERVGEIKVGDKFNSPQAGINHLLGKSGNKEWDYIKKDDQFFYYDVELYCQGKWATRVKERVEVKNKGFNQIDFVKKDLSYVGVAVSIKMDIIGEFKSFSNDKAGDFLASQLEEYLNR